MQNQARPRSATFCRLSLKTLSTKYKLYDVPDALITNKLLQLVSIVKLFQGLPLRTLNFILIIFRDLQIIFRIS